MNAYCHFCSIEILVEDTICRKCEIKYSTFIDEVLYFCFTCEKITNTIAANNICLDCNNDDVVFAQANEFVKIYTK